MQLIKVFPRKKVDSEKCIRSWEVASVRLFLTEHLTSVSLNLYFRSLYVCIVGRHVFLDYCLSNQSNSIDTLHWCL